MPSAISVAPHAILAVFPSYPGAAFVVDLDLPVAEELACGN